MISDLFLVCVPHNPVFSLQNFSVISSSLNLDFCLLSILNDWGLQTLLSWLIFLVLFFMIFRTVLPFSEKDALALGGGIVQVYVSILLPGKRLILMRGMPLILLWP